MADGALKTKALTKDGTVSIRAEKTNVLAADAEGKATGSISLNAKAISLKSMDVDKESLADSVLAAGSSMVLVSEKVFAGAKSKNVKSKKVQVLSEALAAIADKTFEAQQGDGKAVVQLTGGNASVGGSKTTVYGTTEVKSELKAPKATINDVQAKSHFKSQNIEDGMAVGGGGGGSLSAKLKAEECSLIPIKVNIEGSEKNLENVASVAKKDDYSFYIVPNYDEDMQNICEGVAMVHPEFKQKIETIKVQGVDDEFHPGEREGRLLLLTMPLVDDNRYDALKDGVDIFYNECKLQMETALAKTTAEITSLATGEPLDEIKRIKDIVEKIDNKAKEQRDKLYKQKLKEIEDAYNAWLKKIDNK